MKSTSKFLLLALCFCVGGMSSSAFAQEAGEQGLSKEADVSAKPAREGKMTVAVIETSMGEIRCQLFPEAAPKTVENFIGLVKRGYYEGVIFHRIIPEFMIQTGDPTGTGYGGKSIWEIPFEDETTPDLRFDNSGILAMANTGQPRSNGSQFFITLKAAEWLNDRHTIFGEVISGMDVVEAIGAAETGSRDKPLVDISMVNVEIEEIEAE